VSGMLTFRATQVSRRRRRDERRGRRTGAGHVIQTVATHSSVPGTASSESPRELVVRKARLWRFARLSWTGAPDLPLWWPGNPVPSRIGPMH
jgi:hypothetical protein